VAVKLVHKLKLKSNKEWRAYCRGERRDLPPRPNSIPANPNKIYTAEFLEKGGWGAWLGTGTIAAGLRTYQTYNEAVKFVHKLKLNSRGEWSAYCRGERKDLPPKPDDIPTSPNLSYHEQFRERGGWGAWLGTGNRKGGWRPYNDAVKFVHKLKLSSNKEWRAYCRRERKDLMPKPDDIPKDPYEVYGEEFLKKVVGGRGSGLVVWSPD
jgi:hypothetical protein